MPILLPALVMVLLSFQTLAQQSPPPPAAHNSGTLVTDQIGQILFDAAERKAIETFYGHLPSGTGGEIIKEVIKSATSTGTQATENTTDEDKESRTKSKKQKNGNKGKNKQMPPGLAKRDRLPPGLQKQLEKNGTLPPGLAKRDLPAELESQLPPAQDGTERVIAGNDVVLIHQATGVVLDILKDIITN